MDGPSIRVEVVYALPDGYWSVPLELPAGARAADALTAADLSRTIGADRFEPSALAVFGRVVAPDAVLRDGDRLEVLRALLADPKQARRRRADAPGGGN